MTQPTVSSTERLQLVSWKIGQLTQDVRVLLAVHLRGTCLYELLKVTPAAPAAELAGVSRTARVSSSPRVTSSVLSDDQLLSLSTHELNRLLQTMSAGERRRVKERRRTLKNRTYAETCRSRRMTDQHMLRQTNEALVAEVKELKEQVCALTAERDHYREQLDQVDHMLHTFYNGQDSSNLT